MEIAIKRAFCSDSFQKNIPLLIGVRTDLPSSTAEKKWQQNIMGM